MSELPDPFSQVDLAAGMPDHAGRAERWQRRCEVCRKKRAYRSAAAARNAAIARASRAHSIKLKRLRPYQCPVCGLWHLTSRPADSESTHSLHD